MKRNLLIIILLLFSCCFAKVIPIEIENNAEDYTGKSLVSKLREVIRASKGYGLEYSDNILHYKVIISTMDRFKGSSENEGNSTMYTYIILVTSRSTESYYITHVIGFAGLKTLDDLAYSIYSDIDEVITTTKKYYIK